MTEGLLILTLGLTVAAFWKREVMLHFVCIIVWFFMAFYLANETYPAGNTYLPYAATGVCLSMVLVMAAKALQLYFSDRARWPTSSDVQAAHKKKVLGLTKRRGKKWWEEE